MRRSEWQLERDLEQMQSELDDARRAERRALARADQYDRLWQAVYDVQAEEFGSCYECNAPSDLNQLLAEFPDPREVGPGGAGWVRLG